MKILTTVDALDYLTWKSTSTDAAHICNMTWLADHYALKWRCYHYVVPLVWVERESGMWCDAVDHHLSRSLRKPAPMRPSFMFFMLRGILRIWDEDPDGLRAEVLCLHSERAPQ